MVRQVDLKALVSHIVKGDGSDKCRICMGDTTEGQVYLGDTVMMDGDRHVTLAELLETITGVQVETTLVMPKKICHVCYESLVEAHKFMNLCKTSTDQWVSVVKHLEKIFVTEELEAAYVIFRDNPITTAPDIIYYQTKSPKKSKFSLNSSKRKQKELSQKKTAVKKITQPFRLESLKCPECEKPFNQEYSLNIHLKNTNLHFCRHCQNFLKIEDIQKHFKRHDVTIYQCKLCLAIFNHKNVLSRHILYKHKRGNHICYECKLSFSSSKVLSMHIAKKHAHKKCSECNKSFSNNRCYLYHIKQCHNVIAKETKYICDFCSASHTQKTNLITHMKSHLGGCRFQCHYCGKNFPNKFRLKEHNNIHNRVEDRYVCMLCQAKYSTRRGYEKHLKRHAINEGLIVEGPVKPRLRKACHLCERIYASNKSLHNHMEKVHRVVLEESTKS